jgi:hypothetical protein
MTHLDDGTLQAFLDDELPACPRAEVAEHLLGCEQCHESYESLAQANAVFTQSVSVLDVEPPARSPAAGALGGRTRRSTATFVRAAGLVLALAAAASAAVPGSPVREWIERAVEPPAPEPAPVVPVVVEVEEPAAPAPSGVAIRPSSSGRLLVALIDLEDMEIRLESTNAAMASVSVVGAEREPTFSTGSGRVEVRNGAGGTVHVRLPAGVDGARVEVDGSLYAANRDGRLRTRVAADTADGAFIWR